MEKPPIPEEMLKDPEEQERVELGERHENWVKQKVTEFIEKHPKTTMALGGTATLGTILVAGELSPIFAGLSVLAMAKILPWITEKYVDTKLKKLGVKPRA